MKQLRDFFGRAEPPISRALWTAFSRALREFFEVAGAFLVMFAVLGHTVLPSDAIDFLGWSIPLILARALLDLGVKSSDGRTAVQAVFVTLLLFLAGDIFVLGPTLHKP
jgi:hypothetical protein